MPFGVSDDTCRKQASLVDLTVMLFLFGMVMGKAEVDPGSLQRIPGTKKGRVYRDTPVLSLFQGSKSFRIT